MGAPAARAWIVVAAALAFAVSPLSAAFLPRLELGVALTMIAIGLACGRRGQQREEEA